MFFELKLNFWSIILGIVVGFGVSYFAQMAYNKWGRKKPLLELTKDKTGRIDYSGQLDPDISGFTITHVEGTLTYTTPQTDIEDTADIGQEN